MKKLFFVSILTLMFMFVTSMASAQLIRIPIPGSLGGCPRIKKLDRTDQPTNLQKKDVGFLFWIIVNIS